MKLHLLLTIYSTITTTLLFAQQPEHQISFAQESKPYSYYVKQAELWSFEVGKDSLSENSWYNYFRSCRNAQGSKDWRTDFVNDSPYLMEGGKVVKLMEKYIPNTFTFYYLSYLTNGIGTDNYQNLLKAYEMNPNFPGIHSSLISYAESSHNRQLRMEVNKTWHKSNYLSHQLLNYGYNLLMSLDSNAILFVQHDNDTYPVLMLQDALQIRTDIKVISIDFLLLKNSRSTVFKELDVPNMSFKMIDINEYRSNWQKALKQIIVHYKGDRPMYCSMSLFNQLHKEFENHLYTSGLALKYSRSPVDLNRLNQKLVEDVFLLDYLSPNLVDDRNQQNINYLNANYINTFYLVYKIYLNENSNDKANSLRNLALRLAGYTGNLQFQEQVMTLFRIE